MEILLLIFGFFVIAFSIFKLLEYLKVPLNIEIGLSDEVTFQDEVTFESTTIKSVDEQKEVVNEEIIEPKVEVVEVKKVKKTTKPSTPKKPVKKTSAKKK
jgi:hypothetical protein